jgi:hypothetical protein
MRTNEKGTMGGMIDTEMWENRMNLEIHECGNASVERECGTQVNRGGRENQNGGSQKKTGERESKQKIKCTEEISVIREEILKSNERETSGAHQNDVEGKKMPGAQHVGPLQE